MPAIIGVDFSGAKSDTNTWIAQGRLDGSGALLLDSTQPICRAALCDLLANLPPPAAVALDFPFGVPAGFAAQICGSSPPASMPEVWHAVADMTLADFRAARDSFVAKFGEPKRADDAAHFPESYSPLHTVNPNMLPMTYQGIRLLRRWHQAAPQRWNVPPLEPTAAPEDAVTLLELMPGAFLKAIGLPYKGYKRGRSALPLRDCILDGLSVQSGIPLPNQSLVRQDCRANDDCLDAVVAAVAAAAWAVDSVQFRHPAPHELDAARLEGWIYVPSP